MIISERKLIDIIKEAINEELLLEDRESKNLGFARRLLRNNGYSEQQAQQALVNIRQDVPNVHLAKCKFILGVTRMYLNGELGDGRAISDLNTTLKYVGSDAHVNEYDYNLNDMSLNDLVARFSTVRSGDIEQQRNNSNSKQYTANTDYTIVPIDSAEEASKYGKYTNWCVTYDSNMYDNYTSGGDGRFYFCLRKGFENEKPICGEGCPLDSYGLSMIAISVDIDGSLNTCTCRWNHDNGGDDSIMDVDQIEDLLGVNFFETFKPYDSEELKRKGMIGLEALTEGEYIDLGLPSGTKWASCNVGASKPTEYGKYFQWGNPNGVYENDNTTKFKVECYDFSINEFNEVEGVKVPSKEHFEELVEGTDSKWCNLEGVYGRLFTSKVNGNTLFIPAAGYRYGRFVECYVDNADLWSSSLEAEHPSNAWKLSFDRVDIYTHITDYRCCGLCVRGVL